jgi:hypothetical protein
MVFKGLISSFIFDTQTPTLVPSFNWHLKDRSTKFTINTTATRIYDFVARLTTMFVKHKFLKLCFDIHQFSGRSKEAADQG